MVVTPFYYYDLSFWLRNNGQEQSYVGVYWNATLIMEWSGAMTDPVMVAFPISAPNLHFPGSIRPRIQPS